MFTKYATAQILNFADNGKVRTAGKKQKLSGFEYEPRNDGHKYMYVAVRACTADVPNLNYDMLPDSELGGKGKYKTFEGAYVYLNHDNTDPTKARGAIIAARYHDEGDENGDKWVEILEELDEEKCPKLCSLIRSGEIDTVSMGCSVESTTCSICGNTAEYPHEFCEHIQQKGNVYGGKLAYEICNGIDFFECSWVYDPADPTAHVQALNKEASMRKRAGRAKVAVEWYEFDPDHYISEPVGGDCAQVEPKGEGFEAWFMTADDAALSFVTELDGQVFQTAQEAMDAAGDYLTRNASVKTALNPSIPDYPEFSDEGPGGWYSKVGPDQCIVVNYDSRDRGKWWAEYMDLSHPSNGGKVGPFDSFEEAADMGGREFCAARRVAIDLSQPFDPYKLTYEVDGLGNDEYERQVGHSWYEPYHETCEVWDYASVSIKYDGVPVAWWEWDEIDGNPDMSQGDMERCVREKLLESCYWALALRYPEDFFDEYEDVVTLGDFLRQVDSEEAFDRGVAFHSVTASMSREGQAVDNDAYGIGSGDPDEVEFLSMPAGGVDECYVAEVDGVEVEIFRNGGEWSYYVENGGEGGGFATFDDAADAVMTRFASEENAPMPNFADAPRKPDDISTHEDQAACPLCGTLSFDGEYCPVCGYQEPPEGFDDIRLEDEESYEEYEDEASDDDSEKVMKGEDDAADELKEMLSHRIGFTW